MILTYFVLGLLLAFGIARYNQSNKLFWTLFMSFILGIAGGSIYQKLTSSEDEKEETVVTCGQETLNVTTVSSMYCLLADAEETCKTEKSHSMSIHNDVHKETMDFLLKMSMGELPRNKSKPSNKLVCLHISTLADNSA